LLTYIVYDIKLYDFRRVLGHGSAVPVRKKGSAVECYQYHDRVEQEK
jgi:hypothetical protein